MSFIKFNPFNLSITYNIENYFLDDELIYNNEYLNIYLKYLFKYIQTGKIDTELISYIESQNLDQKNKLLHQLSAVLHEKKHFHDYLLSSSGNYIIRRYFYLYSYTLITMVEMKINNKNSFVTPLNRMLYFENDISEGLKFFIDKKNQAFSSIKAINELLQIDSYGTFSSNHFAREISGLGIFEAGAVLTQFSLIEDLFGQEYALVDFQNDYYQKEFPHYTNTIAIIQKMLHLSSSSENHMIFHNNSTINIILFITLNGFTENKKYINNQEKPASRLILILGLLVKEKCNVYDYTNLELFEYIENLLEKNHIISCKNSLLENISLNKKQYDLIKKILDYNYSTENPYTEPLLKAFETFISINENMINKFLDNPIEYLSPLNYIKNFEKNFPVQNIIEFDSGTFGHLFFAEKILNIHDIKPITYDIDNNRLWSFAFKRDDVFLDALLPLYSEFSPLFFTLTEGQKVKFNLVNPKLFDIVMNSLKKQFNIEEAFPITDKELSKKRMIKFWEHQKIFNKNCDLCYSSISKPNGYLISGDELYNNLQFNNQVFKNRDYYKENYSMFCICETCFN